MYHNGAKPPEPLLFANILSDFERSKNTFMCVCVGLLVLCLITIKPEDTNLLNVKLLLSATHSFTHLFTHSLSYILDQD